MSDEYSWAELRDPFIERVGAAPSGPVEERILDVFVQHPQLVATGMTHVGERFDAGQVHSPWPVLAKHVEEAREAMGRGDTTASSRGDRQRLRARALRWVRQVGLLYDRESDVLDELFGATGMLRDYAADDDLASELLTLWRAERPRGEQTERAAVELGLRWAAQRRGADEYVRAHYDERRAAESPFVPPAPSIAMTGNPFISEGA